MVKCSKPREPQQRTTSFQFAPLVIRVCFGFRALDTGGSLESTCKNKRLMQFPALPSVCLGVLCGSTNPSVEVTRFGCGGARFGHPLCPGGVVMGIFVLRLGANFVVRK